MNSESSEDSFYIVRHGESEFNSVQMRVNNSNVEVKEGEDFEAKYCKELIDCGLSETGKIQSAECAKIVAKLPLAYVLVSPLRRALQTADLILKNHPNPPKVIVYPGVREKLSSNCDIGSPLTDLEKEFPTFDFSMLAIYEKPQFWYLYGIPEKAREELLAEIKTKCPTIEEEIENGKYVVLEKIKSLYPSCIEPLLYMQQRIKEASGDIKKRVNEAKDKGKIMLVGHSRAWETLTAESFKENGECVGSKWLHNCEVYEFKFTQ